MSYAPTTPRATLTGTVLAPRIEVVFAFGSRLPNGKGSAQEWVKNLPDRWFDKTTKSWNIAGTGNRPQRVLAEAGIEWDIDPASELVGTSDLDDLWRPVLKLSRNWPGTVVIYPRLAGHTRIKAMIGPAAVWERDKRFFKVRTTDLVKPDGTMDPQLERALQGPTHLLPELAHQVRHRLAAPHPAAIELARSSCVDNPGDQHLGRRATQLINQLRQDTGLDLPADFGLALYPYQAGGAWATAGNVNSLNDEPGLGKGGTVSSRILTPTGWTTYGNVQPGDRVIGSDGRPTTVTGVFPRGTLPVFQVTMSDGTAVTVDGDHLWQVTLPGRRSVIETRELARMIATGAEPEIPMVAPVRFDQDVDGMAPTPRERIEQLCDEFGDHGYQREDGRVMSLNGPDLTRLTNLVQSLGGQVTALGASSEGMTVVLAVLAEVFGGIGTPRRTIVAIEPAGQEEVVCISVDAANHLYVTEHYIVTHNTRQALAAAAIHDADRVLVICPPLVLRNWSREASTAFSPIFARKHGAPPPPTGSKKNPDPDWTTIIQPTRKVPPFPEHGVLVVADSLLASRQELAAQVKDWGPQAIITDEVHRLGNWATARGSAVRWLTEALPGAPAFALTGTPMQAKITELANQLAISGALERDFGSPRQYLERYSREDNFGGRVSIKRMLPELGQRLQSGAIVRRLKKDVLPQLPRKLRAVQYVDISRKHFDEAHKELEAKVAEWFDEFEDSQGRLPTEPELEEWTKTNVSLLSPLRVAAGRAKVKPAIEIITNLLEDQNDARSEDGGYADPIIVWAHHQEVLQDLKAAMPDKWPTAIIDGSVSADNRSAIADQFQAGKISVLFCSIVAAGFGITLTRGNIAYFVESDWTPALISQAEDRLARISQTRPVTCTTLIAEDTLDLHVRAVLHAKEKDLDVVLPGSDHNVTHVDAMWRADGTLEQVEMGTISAVKNEAAILANIAQGVMAKRKKPARR